MTLSAIKVLIIHFLPQGFNINGLKTMLKNLSYFAQVDDLNIKKTRPTLAHLRNYDSVLVFAYQDEKDHSRLKEPDALGDVLSDYILGNKDKGPGNGGVVVAPLTHALAIGGRWRKRKLSPLLPGRRITDEPHLKLGTVLNLCFMIL
jgi:hypothetical protein